MSRKPNRSLECSQVLTELLEYTCRPEFRDEMFVAKEIFLQLCGKLNDDDFSYEQRMQIFQEYFLFEHRLVEPHLGYTIFELFLERAQETFSPAKLFSYEQFRQAFRSLYAVEKGEGDDVLVRDLLSREIVKVKPLSSFSLGGFPSGQIFEGRLVSFYGNHYFTGAFIFHVPAVRSLIERLCRNFLARNVSEAPSSSPDWVPFLKDRFETMEALQNQREQMESAAKKRAIDQLSLVRSFSDVYRLIAADDPVTAIGSPIDVSPFVPEAPLWQRISMLHTLAQCEVRSIRYRHIEPVKVYAQSLAGGKDLMPRASEDAPDQSNPKLRALA